MTKFIDKSTGLNWLIFDYKTPHTNKITSQKLNELNQELNSWQSPNIEEFICGDDKLGETLSVIGNQNAKAFYNNTCCQAFAYINDILVGTAILSTDKSELVQYDNQISDRLKINYIIVNPNYVGKGIGTMMISSINNNRRKFSNNTKTKGSVAWVSPQNKASQKAFLKSKFKRYKKMETSFRSVFYSTNRLYKKKDGMEP